jgi:hypothetical protein
LFSSIKVDLQPPNFGTASTLISVAAMKRFGNRNKLPERSIAVGDEIDAYDTKENPPEMHNTGVADDMYSDQQSRNEVQAGVKKVEAVALIWSKTELYMAYAL